MVHVHEQNNIKISQTRDKKDSPDYCATVARSGVFKYVGMAVVKQGQKHQQSLFLTLPAYISLAGST